jgi:hypothetical protein
MNYLSGQFGSWITVARSARHASSAFSQTGSCLAIDLLGGRMTAQWLSRYALIVLLVLVSLTSAGCEVIGDIFKAGVWVGVFMVVIVLALVGFVAAKIRG